MGKKLTSMLAIFVAACASAPSMPLEVVPRVDLGRYVGTWYEIASFPTWFQICMKVGLGV